jgi:hypothetical protein
VPATGEEILRQLYRRQPMVKTSLDGQPVVSARVDGNNAKSKSANASKSAK